jgi:hypothetical protein
MAKQTKGEKFMARRELSREEEAEMIAEAERASDDLDTDLQVVPAGKMPSSVVLSVRLPLSTARALRAMAAEQGVSLSDLLNAAVTQFISAPFRSPIPGSTASHILVNVIGMDRLGQRGPSVQTMGGVAIDEPFVLGSRFAPQEKDGFVVASP